MELGFNLFDRNILILLPPLLFLESISQPFSCSECVQLCDRITNLVGKYRAYEIRVTQRAAAANFTSSSTSGRPVVSSVSSPPQ